MKNAYIYVNYTNIVVLKTYLDVLKKALQKVGYTCSYVETMNNIDKKSLIVFPMGNDAFKYYFKGYKNILLWQQGVTAEESYMRHSSKLRRLILNFFDCFVMKKAMMVFYVSNALKDYYEKKAHTSFEKKSYIMPCFNEQVSQIDLSKKEYSAKTFAYVGSLSIWQCFEKTLQVYKLIEDKYNDASIKILTFQKDEAEEILIKMGIRNYEIKTVSQSEVVSELKSVNYGFIIRDDSIVNTVATPTKISSYLAAGVIPIYSACIGDFYNVTENLKLACPVHNTSISQISDEIMNFIEQKMDNCEIEKQILDLFSTYYSESYHIERIVHRFKKIGLIGE